ncbi:DUF4116 domain-containing protein [Polynucleobacter rarus]|uniref:DUF4116 domain-containing protein n=1 Tax=Polynucleobacter rarus TaxID=556055 RepID=UPI00131EDFC3|nr:DUF4116 domain-containing protein [Polynucleobacter rarus]
MNKDQAYQILSEYNEGSPFKDLPKNLREDPELARLAVEKDCNNILYLSKILLDDRSFILDLIGRVFIRSNARILTLLPKKYSFDREVVMAVLSTWDCESLQDASDELRNDCEVVWNAMFKNQLLWSPLVYEFAGKSVLIDKEFLDKCLNEIKSYRGPANKEIANSLKNWHRISLAKNKGDDFGKIEELKISLKNLKKEVREATDFYGRERANKNLINLMATISSFNGNAALMKLLVEIDYSQYEYDQLVRGNSILQISEKLMADQKFVTSLMKVTKGEVLGQLPKQYKTDKQFIKDNIGEKTKADSFDQKLCSEISFMLEMAKLIESSQFEKFPKKSLWADKNFVLPIVQYNGLMIKNVTSQLKKDREIALAALNSSPYSVIYSDPSFYSDKSYMLEALKTDNGNAIECLREPLMSDVDFFLECLLPLKKKTSGSLSKMARAILRSVPLALRKNKKLIIPCLEMNGWAIENVPEEIKYDRDVLEAAFKSGAAVYVEFDLMKLRTLYNERDLRKIIKNESYLNAVMNG